MSCECIKKLSLMKNDPAKTKSNEKQKQEEDGYQKKVERKNETMKAEWNGRRRDDEVDVYVGV